jgi:hypothetical protein
VEAECSSYHTGKQKELFMRSTVLIPLTSAAVLLAGTLVAAAQGGAQRQPGGEPSTESPQGRQEELAPRAAQPPRAAPQQGTVGQQPGARPELITPRERQEQLPLQPGGRPATESPQGKQE